MPHLKNVNIPVNYTEYIGKKIGFLVFLFAAAAAFFIAAVSIGPVYITPGDTIKALLGVNASRYANSIIINIRLPQALTAVLAGAGLAAAGTSMQSVLRNPLGSPFTLGISNAAAFGAALSVMILGSGAMTSANQGAASMADYYITSFSAFACSFLAALVIIGVTRMRGASPEVMVLTGVAVGSLFTAGTMFLQYFADDVQLAAMVFWTFGDLARASWNQIGFLAVSVFICCVFFALNRWNYNAIDSGDETAQGLGVNVGRVRIAGMMVSSLITAVIVALLGVIGFIGLVCPHMVRRIIGDDHRFLLPGSCLAGASLLLISDTAARIALPPHSLPVSILTAFMGAPVFIFLIIRGYKR
jgi:iron complex transport system permease protein